LRKNLALALIFAVLIAGFLTNDWPYLWRCRPPCRIGDDLTNLWGYPPLIKWWLSWLKPLDYRAYLWCGVVVIGMLASLWIWTFLCTRRVKVSTILFSLLLIGQYPVFMAMRQGNPDVLIVLFYSFGTFLFLRRNYFFSGFAIGLSIMLKVFPVVSVGLLAAGLLLRSFSRKGTWKILAVFLTGVVISFAFVFLFSLRENYEYFTSGLPTYMTWPRLQLTPSWAHSRHSGEHLGRVFPIGGELLMIFLTFTWLVAAFKSALRDPLLVLAGLLAISTYYQCSAFDYNLTTTYPLFLVLLIRASRSRDYLFILAGLLAIMGPRFIWLELTKFNNVFDWLPTALSVLWLTMVAMIALTHRKINSMR